MFDSCPDDKTSNLSEIDTFIKENKKEFERYIYGFKEDKDISMEIFMQLQSSLIVKTVFYLHMRGFKLDCISKDLVMSQQKIFKIILKLIVEDKLKLSKNMNTFLNMKNELDVKLNLVISKYSNLSNLKCELFIGSVNTGKTIRELSIFNIDDLGMMNMEELVRGDEARAGLKLHIKHFPRPVPEEGF